MPPSQEVRLVVGVKGLWGWGGGGAGRGKRGRGGGGKGRRRERRGWWEVKGEEMGRGSVEGGKGEYGEDAEKVRSGMGEEKGLLGGEFCWGHNLRRPRTEQEKNESVEQREKREREETRKLKEKRE